MSQVGFTQNAKIQFALPGKVVIVFPVRQDDQIAVGDDHAVFFRPGLQAGMEFFEDGISVTHLRRVTEQPHGCGLISGGRLPRGLQSQAVTGNARIVQ